MRPRTVVREAALVLLLGSVLACASLGLLVLQYGSVRFGVSDLVTAEAAGATIALVVRATVLLHRRWKGTLGRFTAAAGLCALAALAGALIAWIPGTCPGGLPGAGRCGVRETAAWGQVAGVAAVLNFMLAGIALAIFRGVRNVITDSSQQSVIWIRAAAGAWRRRTTRRRPDPARGPGEPKGRPTPRRSDAERARRDRLRART